MSRVGKNPVAIPAGRHRRPQGPASQGQGQAGRAAAHGARRRRGHPGRRRRSTSSRAPTAAAPACSGARRATSPATWCSGVSDGFTINLEINGVGYRAQADAKNLKLQLGFSHDVEVPDSRRHPDQGAEADRDRDHRRRSSEGRASSRPRSAACVRPSPTRARASSTRPRRSAARKARRSRGDTMSKTERSFRPPPAARALQAAPGRRRPSAPQRLPLGQAHLCPGHRRP